MTTITKEAARANELIDIRVVTLSQIPGFKITKVFDLAATTHLLTKKGYPHELEDNKISSAERDLAEQAHKMGGNAVVGVTATLAANEYLLCSHLIGTVVTIEPENQPS
jgi:uncharacterized protein YbjQ (UPF0145 family)